MSPDISQVYLKETRSRLMPRESDKIYTSIKVYDCQKLWAAVKMQGTVFIFQISAVGNKLLIGIWTGKVYWSYSHARLPKAFESSKRNNLFGKFVECALDVDKTCNDINQTLWEYRGLLSRKCTVKIHEVMVNNAHKIYLNLHFLTGSTQTARVKVVCNSSAADNRFEGIARASRIL